MDAEGAERAEGPSRLGHILGHHPYPQQGPHSRQCWQVFNKEQTTKRTKQTKTKK